VSQNLPSGYHLVYDRKLIAKRTAVLGSSVSEWAMDNSQTERAILCVCVLRGGALFFSDLIREISVSVDVGFCRARSYSSDNKQFADGAIQLSAEDLDVRGRRVLIIDDICDSGKTLSKLQSEFTEQGAVEIRTAVLIHRRVESSVFTPSWTAFEYIGNEWFVGYGMADEERFYNLPEIYSILAK